MRTGRRIPCDVNALYGSEVMFGYDKNLAPSQHQYRVDGVKMTYRQICEALPTVDPQLISTRIHVNQGRYDYSLAELGRPLWVRTERGQEAITEGMLARSKRLSAGRRIGRDKHLGAKEKRFSHQQVIGRVPTRYPKTSNSFKAPPLIQAISDYLSGPSGVDVFVKAIKKAQSDRNYGQLARVVQAVFTTTITYVDASDTVYTVEIAPKSEQNARYERLFENATANSHLRECQFAFRINEALRVGLRLLRCNTVKQTQQYSFEIVRL